MIQYPHAMPEKPAPKPTRTPMTTERPHVVGVRFSDGEVDAVKERAEAEGLKLAAFVRRATLIYLESVNKH